MNQHESERGWGPRSGGLARNIDRGRLSWLPTVSSSAPPPRLRLPSLSFVLALLVGVGAGCASSSGAASAAATSAPSTSSTASPGSPAAQPVSGDWLEQGEAALAAEDPARAAALLARGLGEGADGDVARRAYQGLALAHEQLGDFDAAIRAYDSFVARFPAHPDTARMLARRGACEAEVYEWARSASSYAQVLELGAELLVPSQRVEALTRRGYALYQLGDHEQADAVFAEADALYREATQGGEERFADTYFVAMARFYRAAILHLRFREIRVRLPEAQMQADFERKLELLEQAQEAYNEVVRARHIYWVSAAGYQLGSLFQEFYDAMMYAPVPDWLDEGQRRTYYLELEGQLRPVVDKAVWVFEQNLETARKLGYDNDFITRSEEQLAHLQAILLGREDTGGPVPRLAPPDSREQRDPDAPIAHEDLPAIERKLFVPMPTTL